MKQLGFESHQLVSVVVSAMGSVAFFAVECDLVLLQSELDIRGLVRLFGIDVNYLTAIVQKGRDLSTLAVGKYSHSNLV